MKPVDPLPGGLHSTPEMNALALRGGYAAGPGRAHSVVESYTPPMAPSVPMFPSPPAPDLTAQAPAPAPDAGAARQPHAVAPVRVVMPQEVRRHPARGGRRRRSSPCRRSSIQRCSRSLQQADRRSLLASGADDCRKPTSCCHPRKRSGRCAVQRTWPVMRVRCLGGRPVASRDASLAADPTIDGPCTRSRRDGVSSRTRSWR